MLLLRLGYTSLWLPSFPHSHAHRFASSVKVSFHVVSCTKERYTWSEGEGSQWGIEVLYWTACEELTPANNHMTNLGNWSFPLKLWDDLSFSWQLGQGLVKISHLCRAWTAELKRRWDDKHYCFKNLSHKYLSHIC